MSSLSTIRSHTGRGTGSNPAGRFESLDFELDPDVVEELRRDPEFEIPKPETEFLRDDSQSVLTRNKSPDLGFDASLNPYRGCEHGCAYCYARPYHEYLGFSAGLDFETRILVKPNAPDLLEAELNRPSWVPQLLACSGVTDCYQPVEKSLKITRGCLEVLANMRQPVGLVTKNHLITRDIDVLQELARFKAVKAMISITSLDSRLAARLEPRAASPSFRLDAVRRLSEAGIPTGISLAPVIPGLNDHEIPAILEAAAAHGATFSSWTMVRLPHGVKDLFLSWLDEWCPEKRERVEHRIREVRGGALNQNEFGDRFRGEGELAQQIGQMFDVSARKHGLNQRKEALSTAHFRRSRRAQMELF